MLEKNTFLALLKTLSCNSVSIAKIKYPKVPLGPPKIKEELWEVQELQQMHFHRHLIMKVRKLTL